MINFCNKVFVLERQELYDELWSVLIKGVCNKYGCHYSKIQEICKSYNIPMPDNKYRARIKSNKYEAVRKPLPVFEGNTTITIINEYFKDGKKILFGYLDDDIREKAIEIYEKLEVPNKLYDIHPVLKRIIDNRKIGKKFDGNVRCGFTVNVSLEQEDRIYRICNALFKAVEEIGGKVKYYSNYNVSSFLIRDVNIDFYFKEKSNVVRVYEVRYGQEELITKYEPKGIVGYSDTSSIYYNLVDNENIKLENYINEMFKRLLDYSEEHQPYPDEYIKYCTDIKEAERLKIEENKKRKENELRMLSQLIKDVSEWKLANDTREYIRYISSNNYESIIYDRFKLSQKDYIEWANNIADWIDPLISKKNELLGNVNKSKLFDLNK